MKKRKESLTPGKTKKLHKNVINHSTPCGLTAKNIYLIITKILKMDELQNYDVTN